MNLSSSAVSRRHVVLDYAIAALSLAGLYGVYLLVVSPQHEFPLHDDWAYAQTVQRLLDTGTLRISDWASPTLIFQVYWGAFFVKLFGGFSFTALRWSTLTFSFIGSLALYDLMRQLDLPAPAALLGMAALVVNPLFAYLSYTFMSDVFYLGLMLLTLAFYVRGIKHDAEWALLAGSLLASAAYLERQVGLVLPVAAAVALALKHRRLRWKPLLLVSVLPVLVFIGHNLWLRYIHGLTWGLELSTLQRPLALLRDPMTLPLMSVRLLLSLSYLGIFSLPVLFAHGFGLKLDRARLVRKSFIVWFVVLAAPILAMVAFTGQPMPYMLDVINRNGMGVASLAGQKTPETPSWVFWLVTMAAPFAGAAQGAFWTDTLRNARREVAGPGTVLLIASLLMAGLTAAIGFLVDRYLLVFIPVSIYLVLRSGLIKQGGGLIGLGVCVTMLVYNLIELGDRMAWTTASWTAGQQLVAQGIPPETIDGGEEWIGWYEFETALPMAIAQGKGNDMFAWRQITPKRFVLAFEPLSGYRVYGQVAYRSPPFGRAGQIYILERPAP